jgi:hypothetical protein
VDIDVFARSLAEELNDILPSTSREEISNQVHELPKTFRYSAFHEWLVILMGGSSLELLNLICYC